MENTDILNLTDRAATKAMSDLAFRKALVEDGNAAIKSEFKEEIPVKVTFHEFREKKFVFVLPAKATDGQLSDDDLVAVSGGQGELKVMSNISNIDLQNVMNAYACFPRNIKSDRDIKLAGSENNIMF